MLCALLALHGRFYVEGRLVQQLTGHMISLGLKESHPTIQVQIKLPMPHITVSAFYNPDYHYITILIIR